MENERKIIVAVTGASGAIYSRLLIEKLIESNAVGQIAVIVSESGAAVAEFEKVTLPHTNSDHRIRYFEPHDLFAPPASGSAGYQAMVIVPCSMGTIGRIACGTSGDLISRAADVMLKERRKLVAVVRETPLNLIHLRNMELLSSSGAVIMPASPSFYSHPTTIEELCMSVVERILAHLEIESERYVWGEN